jgi:hypothetical protein
LKFNPYAWKGLPWMNLFRTIVRIWENSSSANMRDMAEEVNSKLDYESVELEGLPSKYWLTSSGINLLSKELNVAVVVVMRCSNFCGFVAADASSFVDDRNRHMICLLYENNHYLLLLPDQVFLNEVVGTLWNIYFKISRSRDTVCGKYTKLLGKT